MPFPDQNKPGKAQRGVALITALLVVALATTISVAVLWQQHIDMRRTENVLDSGQLRLYLAGVEGWAGKILERDQQEGRVDHLEEDWAYTLPPMPVDHGTLAGSIEDAQARFNLNNVLSEGKVSAEDLAAFRRLLAQFSAPAAIADALVDWLDADSELFSGQGAEDDAYLGLQPAYRSANQLMVDASELRLVAGMDDELYRQLEPYIIALPARTQINLNTAPAVVLMTLADDLNRSEIEAFADRQNTRRYADVAEALKHPAFAKRSIPQDGLSVASRYFMLMSTLQIGRLQQHYTSLLQRNDNGSTASILRTQRQ